MKVLYLGHYREGTGWSKVAIEGILALDHVGVDVVCRNINLTERYKAVPKRIEELEKKSVTGSEYCIQHVLPHHTVGSQNFKKNIAYVELESIFTKKNTWHHSLSLLDEVWVPNDDQKLNMQQFIEKKIQVVPHASSLQCLSEQKTKDNIFRFYSIVDLNQRKNLEKIVRCYYHTFKRKDNVELVLKVTKFGVEGETLYNALKQMIQRIMNEMRIGSFNSYPSISLITEEFTDGEIMNLHNYCDCYVGISRGEAWSIPSFDAMAVGNTPICSNEGGPKMFIDHHNKNTGTLVNGSYAICNQQDGAFNHIFTGSEFWFEADDIEICAAMKYYYENKDATKKTEGMEQAKKFDYTQIGNKMKEALNA